MLEISVGELIALVATVFGLPTAFTGVCVWRLKRKIEKSERITEERDKAREENENFLINTMHV